MNYLEQFAENIKHLREVRKLKQSEMLAECGFKQPTWSGYEQGLTFPNVQDLIKISEYFRVLESDLIHTDISESNLMQLHERYEYHVNSDLYPNGISNLYPEHKEKTDVLNEPLSSFNKALNPPQNTLNLQALLDSQATTISALQSALLHAETVIKHLQSPPKQAKNIPLGGKP